MRRLSLGLLCLVTFAIPCEALIAFPAVGTLARILGIVAASIGVFSVIADRQLRRPGLLFWLVCVFMLWNGLTLFWSIDPELSANRIATYAQLLALVWLIWEFAATGRERQLVMQAYVLGAYVSLTATLLNFVTGAARDSGRYAAFNADANDLGLSLALGIPMAWQLMLRQQSRLARWVNGAYLPAAIFAVLLTASRGAFLATVVATSIVLWSFARLNGAARLHTMLLVVAAAIAAYAFVPATSWQRLAEGRAEVEGGDLSYRLVIWRAGAREFLAHPATGVGAGAFRVAVEPALGRAWAAHNTYLAILVEQGLMGFALFALVCAVLLWRVRSMPPWERRLCLVLLLTWAVGVVSLTWEHRKPTWFVLGILIAYAGAARPTRAVAAPGLVAADA